jgi:hypothetical protein
MISDAARTGYSAQRRAADVRFGVDLRQKKAHDF